MRLSWNGFQASDPRSPLASWRIATRADRSAAQKGFSESPESGRELWSESAPTLYLAPRP